MPPLIQSPSVPAQCSAGSHYRGLCTSGMLLIAWLVPLSGVAQDSLYDYFTKTNRDFSREARQRLWRDFRPGEKYELTAEQNLQLLKAIKLFDSAPKLTLESSVVLNGQDVRARIGSTSRVLIESGLNSTSANYDPDSVVVLGRAVAGTAFITVKSSVAHSGYVLWMFPEDRERISLVLIESTSPIAAPISAKAATAPGDLFAKFVKHISADAFKRHLEEALPMWLTENAGAIGETTVVCAVGGPVSCAAASGIHGVALTVDVLIRMVNDSPLEPSEKAALIEYFQLATTATQLFSPGLGPSKSRICTIADMVLTAADNVAGAQIESDNVRITARLMIQENKKFLLVLCAKRL